MNCVNKRLTSLDKLFDRKTFDPSVYRSDDDRILSRLRNPGFMRACAWRVAEEQEFSSPYPNVYAWRKLESTAMGQLRAALSYKRFKKDTTFLDIGSGHSVDTRVALREGAKTAYRLDLFEASYSCSPREKFLKADCAEKIPLKAASVNYVLCQAMANLIEPAGRKKFYKEVRRVIKSDGLFVIYVCDLRNAWGWQIEVERKNLSKAGFEVLRNFPGGFVIKPK